MNSLADLTIVDAGKKLAAGEITAVDLAKACLANVEARNKELNVYLEVFDDVLAQAEAADVRRKAGENHPLLGIPLAIKDNILIEGRVASAASKMLENYVATYDATVVKKLKEAGAVFVGRSNMDEFALGGSTENSAFGPTKNPHDPTRVAGGTSGGSAAAVAAGMCLGALGTDTGGSVRNPASFCGVVGVKPTYGKVSRFGLVAAASSFDQCGPLAKTVEDAEILFNAIAGQDTLDSTSIDPAVYPAKTPAKKIGVPHALLGQGVEPDIRTAFDVKIEALKAKGYEIVDVDIPSLSYALAAYYIINFAEVSANLARFDGVRYGLSKKGENLLEDYAASRAEGFGKETRRRIMLGTYVLSSGYYDAYYGRAGAAREMLRREVAGVLKGVDAIAMPTMPMAAWKVGEKEDPLAAYLADIFTVTANLTGNPALSLPMGTVARDGANLPVGFQLMGAHGDEAGMLAIGKELQ